MGDVTSFIVVDAVDPFKSLSFLRYKVLYIHLTNVYDNLPTDEMVLRDGRYFFVEVRAYVKADDAEKLSDKYGVSPDTLVKTVSRLLDVGPDYFPDADEGVGFWQDVWAVVNLEERLVALDSLSEAELPAGVRASHIEELVGDTSADIRFHLSSGAVESFTNTIPLLHPRGYLQVQDIFVTDIASYLQGFRGPGKMDGSIVNWVNGALLAEVGEQAGYGRALYAIQLPRRVANVDSPYDSTGVIMKLPILPTAVVGSYSMPGWLERLKTEYSLRKISPSGAGRNP